MFNFEDSGGARAVVLGVQSCYIFGVWRRTDSYAPYGVLEEAKKEVAGEVETSATSAPIA
jgi:hypothetical protein